MYVQGVSTPKVKAATGELCGHEFFASTISRLNQKRDEELEKFVHRQLGEPYRILFRMHATKVREGGVIPSQAVMIAPGVDWEGHRSVLVVEMVHRESHSSGKISVCG
jgi:putative transposase